MTACPVDYQYAPAVLNRPAEGAADTAYVVGGLYGNVEALHAIQAMARAEERPRNGQRGPPVLLIFNGDFHWFDALAEDFAAIQQGVLPHWALAGNVEAELARSLPTDGSDADCGCGYPDYVDAGVVERSNRIFARLKRTALALPGVTRDLARLPRHGVLEVGGQRIGILHGDAHSLSGWAWAAEALAPAADAACASSAIPQTDPAGIAADFRAAAVLAFATTHTCLPFLQGFPVDGGTRLIVNNGSAGMANFRGTEHGLITRISARPETPADSLYGASAGGVRFDALPVRYPPEAWRSRFLAAWPPLSDAYRSYYGRIVNGPAWTVEDALRIGKEEDRAQPTADGAAVSGAGVSPAEGQGGRDDRPTQSTRRGMAGD